MSNVKKDLLAEIDRKVIKHREAKERAITRNTIDAFVLSFIKNVEELNYMPKDDRDWGVMVHFAQDALTDQIRSFDSHATCTISWVDQDEHLPIVNGVLISWSPAYQKAMNCDPELFVDVTSLLFS